MARAPGESREPWVKVKVGLRRSDKVGRLPNAAARWGWTCTLLEAKTQRRMGVFASRRHLRDLLGAEGRWVADFLSVGLLHEIPGPPAKGEQPDLAWCESGRCARDYQDAMPGELVVHDYRREQRDPTNADRQAGWRDRNKDAGQDPSPDGPADPPDDGPRNAGDNGPRNGSGNALGNGTDNAVRNGPRNGSGNAHGADRADGGGGDPVALDERTHGRAPAPSRALAPAREAEPVPSVETPHQGPSRNGPRNGPRNGLLTRAGNDGDGDGDNRDVERLIPGSSVGSAGERVNEPLTNGETHGPRLTRAQLEAWSTWRHAEWDPFRAAWLGRGFPWPPGGDPTDDPDTSVRSRLWEIAQDRPESLGRWVAEARGPKPYDVIADVFAAWSGFRADAGVEDPEWAEAKAADRRAANGAMTRLGDLVGKERDA